MEKLTLQGTKRLAQDYTASKQACPLPPEPPLPSTTSPSSKEPNHQSTWWRYLGFPWINLHTVLRRASSSYFFKRWNPISLVQGWLQVRLEQSVTSLTQAQTAGWPHSFGYRPRQHYPLKTHRSSLISLLDTAHHVKVKHLPENQHWRINPKYSRRMPSSLVGYHTN